MFDRFKKNAANAAQAAPEMELTPEQIADALEKEQKRIRRKATFKKVLKNTFNGVVSAAVGIITYKLLEDHFGGSDEVTDTTIQADTTADLEAAAMEADASYDYTSLD